jgi:hypothetical protein
MATYKILDGEGTLRYVKTLGSGAVNDPYSSVTIDGYQVTVDEGKAFFHADRHVISNNAEMRYLLKTGTTHSELYTLSMSTSSAPVRIEVFEGTLVSANGSTETLHNMNRQSASASTNLLYLNPTVTSDATELLSLQLEGAKNIGSHDTLFHGRMIFKASENYMIRITNTSGATATVSILLEIGED